MHFCNFDIFCFTKFDEKRILFYSNQFYFSLSPARFRHVSISILNHRLVRAQLRALFTLASAFVRPKVGLRKEAVQNLLSLSMFEWHVENASSGKEEVLTPEDSLSFTAEITLGGEGRPVFDSEGPALSCGYFTAILSRRTRAQLNARYLGAHNAREICFQDCKRSSARFTIRREAAIKLMVNYINFMRHVRNVNNPRGRGHCKFPLCCVHLTRRNFRKFPGT